MLCARVRCARLLCYVQAEHLSRLYTWVDGCHRGGSASTAVWQSAAVWQSVVRAAAVLCSGSVSLSPPNLGCHRGGSVRANRNADSARCCAQPAHGEALGGFCCWVTLSCSLGHTQLRAYALVAAWDLSWRRREGSGKSSASISCMPDARGRLRGHLRHMRLPVPLMGPTSAVTSGGTS